LSYAPVKSVADGIDNVRDSDVSAQAARSAPAPRRLSRKEQLPALSVLQL